MTSDPIAEPHVFVILGATGDLTKRKLLPAIHRLSETGRLGKGSLVVGTGRREMSDAGFRQWAGEGLDSTFLQSLRYVVLPPDSRDAYRGLAAKLEALEGERGLPQNRVFYLSLPPAAFPAAIEGLGAAGLNRARGFSRLVIEKPFGSDLATAEELNRHLHRQFAESQVYRIDHYLGKETVQNLLVFRFANQVFESLWNRDRIESVEITVAESIGVEKRSSYYDGIGAVRDMVQNHLAQLLSLVAMEVPSAYRADTVRFEKVKALRSVLPLMPEDVVLGQYAPGRMGDQDVAGYRQESGVPADSRTETYAALRLRFDSWRWQGVPFYLRTGKRMPRQTTEIVVTFQRAPVCLFTSFDACQIHSNVLRLTLQPEEGFSLFFDVKQPGEPMSLKTLPLDFKYRQAFQEMPTAYETLLLDVLMGDQTLFVHADEVEASWQLFTPLLERRLDVHPYAAGTWGPAPADELLARRGHRWHSR